MEYSPVKRRLKLRKSGFSAVPKEIREKIVAQALEEIQFARNFKSNKTQGWKLNEDLYYGNIRKGESSRANVDLARMQEFVHTLLSKIDSPLTFKFTKRKDSQMRRVELLNSLRDFDANRDDWDLKDIAGKKQMVIYGRAIYSYAAHSMGGYMPDLRNVDVYNFLVDPSAGGLNINKARYCGDYGVIKTRQQLEEGAKKGGMYIKEEVSLLLDPNGIGNNTEDNEESMDKESRTRAAQKSGTATTEKDDPDKFVFWQWGTTFEGERYYLLLTERGGRAVRVVKADEMFGCGRWWYWTYAAYPDMTEFWTPSSSDYVREIFMAQAVSINQMIDNAEQINKPQKIVDVSAVQNLAELKYRKDGIIKAKAGLAASAIKILETPSIRTPIEVYNVLESIQQRASGVTDAAAGVADTDGRATIYEGNQAATAGRFNLFNKSYSAGYKTFGRLYEWGVRDHMIQKTAIDIVGPEGVSLLEVSRGEVFQEDTEEEFGLIVESSNAELLLSTEERRTQLAAVSAYRGDPTVDQEDLARITMQLAGVDDDHINQLLDKSESGDARLRADAARDVELLLDGNILKPNRKASPTYQQYILDYLQDHGDKLDDETFERVIQYSDSLRDVIIRNTMRRAQETIAREQAAQAAGVAGGKPPAPVRVPGPSQPLQDVIEQNNNV